MEALVPGAGLSQYALHHNKIDIPVETAGEETPARRCREKFPRWCQRRARFLAGVLTIFILVPFVGERPVHNRWAIEVADPSD